MIETDRGMERKKEGVEGSGEGGFLSALGESKRR